MPVRGLNGAEFHGLAGQILQAGHRLRFQATGGSMFPFIQNGDFLEVAPLAGTQIKCGDVLLAETGHNNLLAHRVVKTGHRYDIPFFLIKGDSCTHPDGWLRLENILGRVEAVEHGSQQIKLTTGAQQWRTRLWVIIAPWVPRFSWLPLKFRHIIRNWLFGSLIPD